MTTHELRALWNEPRPRPVPGPTRWDGLLVALLLPITVLEGLLREGIVWRPLAIGVGAAIVVALPWRRVHPLLLLVGALAVSSLAGLAAMLAGVEWVDLHSHAVVLLLVYALFRWGSGREAAAGLALMLAAYALSALEGDVESVGDAIGGAVVLGFPAVLGASVRFRAKSRQRELEQVRLRERGQLARELHDTVAHHVSAIVLQAQAGRAVAATRPGAPLEALAVIESEAARTLKELRALVGALRDDVAPELRPQAGVADLEQLVRSVTDGPAVVLEREGPLHDLEPLVGAALFRLAQESLTNAVRHARNASRIVIRIEARDTDVRLTARDDGDRKAFSGAGTSGYGLVGMAERAALLGGTFRAGPNPDRGWSVEAVLPRRGERR